MLFETERLVVKEAAESDIERIIRLESQPDVRDYLWIGTTEEHKEEIRNLIESKIGKKLDIDVRQVEEGRRFEDSFVDIEKLINMDIVVEDD